MGNIFSGDSSFGKTDGSVYVRVRTLSQGERTAFSNPKWIPDMDDTMGMVGIICGGRKEKAMTRVLFIKRSDGSPDWWNYHDATITRVTPALDFPQEYADHLSRVYSQLKKRADTGGGSATSNVSTSPHTHIHMANPSTTTTNSGSDTIHVCDFETFVRGNSSNREQPTTNDRIVELITINKKLCDNQVLQARKIDALSRKIDALSLKIDTYYDVD